MEMGPGEVIPVTSVETKRDILAETVRQVLNHTVIEPFNRDAAEAFDKIHGQVEEIIEPILGGKFAQCPECGSAAFASAMCEGVKFTCPTCEAELVWALKEKTNRYVLVKPSAEYPEKGE